MVINSILVAIAMHLNKPYSRTIYHVASSKSNPLQISSFICYVCDYFAEHPLMSRQGNLIETTDNVNLLSSISSFNMFMAIRYLIPLKVLNSLYYTVYIHAVIDLKLL